MNRRMAKYWMFGIIGGLIISWFWALLGHYYLPPNADFWVFMFIFSCACCVSGFCVLMVFLYYHNE